MSALANFFLRAKHLQIFLLLFGIRYLGGSAAILIPWLTSSRSPEDLLRVPLSFEFVMVLFMFCLVAWLWSMGSFLSSIGQPSLRLKRGFFRFALVYPAVYIFAFLALFGAFKPMLIAVIFPLHLFAMYCMFYDLYFVSKSLALIETGDLASFYDYAGSFFLLWFFPIGIWYIQPRINRLYALPPAREVGIASPGISLQVGPPNSRAVDRTAGTSLDIPPAYAGLWLRIAAALIDGSLLSFVVIFLVMITNLLGVISKARGFDLGVGIIAVLIADTFVVPWFYFSFLESCPWQATIGKNVLRLYVTDLEGRRLSRGRALGRNLAKCLSNLTIGIGYLICGFTKKKQALHDFIAKSQVLRRPQY